MEKPGVRERPPAGFELSDYDYALAQELIAQRPAHRRDSSRLLVVDRRTGFLASHTFREIASFLSKGDLVVVNDTRVIPARLMGKRRTGGRVEVFLLRPWTNGCVSGRPRRYQALIKPLGRLRINEEIYFKGGFSCRILDAKNKIVEFGARRSGRVMEKVGLIPLPPYIRREPDASDRRRYQTVFAKHAGAVAAPTAGLHFTKNLLKKITKRGVRVASLTLHVNYGTFAPVRCLDIRAHKVEEEYYHIPAATVALIRQAKREKKRVFAVGTTVTRALETCADDILSSKSRGDLSGGSRLFIYPPFGFKVVDALITNFHLPRTSLLMLVAAFGGRDLVLEAYREAVRQRYRFYSYGDAMLIT